MPYALALALDDASARVVRALWRDVADAGFPWMAESGANPHVSLAIWDEIDRDAMPTRLERFAAETPAIDVVFPRVGTFDSAGVVYLEPEVGARLREVHAQCRRAFADLGRGAWPHYAPGVWVPHCTLAMDFGAALDRIAAGARRAALPLRGRLERAEIVEFRPVRHLAVAALAAAPEA
jgi:2'-5' RNA ligase